MRFEDFEPARPRAGEVLVRVRAAAVNPYDWKIRNGEMNMMTGRKFPQGSATTPQVSSRRSDKASPGSA